MTDLNNRNLIRVVAYERRTLAKALVAQGGSTVSEMQNQLEITGKIKNLLISKEFRMNNQHYSQYFGSPIDRLRNSVPGSP